MATTPAPEKPPDPFLARFGASWRTFGIALAGVVIAALVAGVVFSRTDPQRAAHLLIRDRVTTEPAGESIGPPAPSTGEPQGPPVCGVSTDMVDVQTQIDTLAAGVIVLQYRSDSSVGPLEAVAAERLTNVLVAPNPDLTREIVATAWGRRMRLDTPDNQLLRAFVTAHAGLGPRVLPCNP